MSQVSAYIRYRSSAELDALTVAYIQRMETEFATGKDKPDHRELIRIMDLFVAESIDILLVKSIDTVGLHPTAKKLVHGLASVVESTASMLVGKVAKGLDAGQHRRLAAYMKSVRILVEEDGQQYGDIAFAVPADVAQRGWAAARYALSGGANDPQMVKDGVKKSALSLVDKVVPRLEPQQIAIAAEYFATLVRTGPYLEKFGEVTELPLFNNTP